MPTHSPVSVVAEHPAVRRQHDQRRELARQIEQVQTDIARLRTERIQLEQGAVSRAAASLLLDAATPVDGKGDARVPALDVTLAELQSRLASLELALQQHDVIAKGVLEGIQRVVDRQILVAAQALVADMVPLVEQLLALNSELNDLHARANGALTLPTPLHPGYIQMWLAQARGGGGQ